MSGMWEAEVCEVELAGLVGYRQPLIAGPIAISDGRK
jgi:hypothetical protein